MKPCKLTCPPLGNGNIKKKKEITLLTKCQMINVSCKTPHKYLNPFMGNTTSTAKT